MGPEVVCLVSSVIFSVWKPTGLVPADDQDMGLSPPRPQPPCLSPGLVQTEPGYGFSCSLVGSFSSAQRPQEWEFLIDSPLPSHRQACGGSKAALSEPLEAPQWHSTHLFLTYGPADLGPRSAPGVSDPLWTWHPGVPHGGHKCLWGGSPPGQHI